VQPGGFILFGRNLQSPGQVRELCDELRALCDTPPILTLDQEGGRVSRLKDIGHQPPSADQLRRCGDTNLIRRHGELTATLLRLFGFNLNLAPVADILLDSEAENSLLNRCYGTSADEVISKAGVFLDAMQDGGVCGTVKHFPGYSLCSKDPHGSLPLVDRSREEMEEHELKVFRALLHRSASAMIGHAVYPVFDPDGCPSSLSSRIIRDLLIGEIGYGGLVMTDDLEMGAISYEYGVAETVRMAIDAGNDLLLFCHQRECVEIALTTLSRLPADKCEKPLAKMREFKSKLSPAREWSAVAFDSINTDIQALREKCESRLAQA